MAQARRGYGYGVAAYLLWGVFPVYFKLLLPAEPLEILAHRVIWSAVFVALLLGAARWLRGAHRAGNLRRLVRRPRTLLGMGAGAVLIAANWGTFIYGVNSDRVVEASLGYFVTPLVTMLLGVLALRERLRAGQWLAVGIGAVAVSVLAVDYGRLPYVALGLAGSFGLYGLVKKTVGAPAMEGLLVETALLCVPAAGYLWWLTAQGAASVGTAGVAHTGLVLGVGAVTAVPLLLFAAAANRIPLSAMGILQYLAPTLQFLLGVFGFGEPMPPARLAGFTLVWLALVIFSGDALRHVRTARLARGQVAATEPAAAPDATVAPDAATIAPDAAAAGGAAVTDAARPARR